MQRVIHQEVGNVHDDVEALCPRMVIIDHGRKLYDGGIASIRERFGGERTLIATLEDLPHGVRLVRVDGPRLLLGFGRDSLPAHELVAWLGARHRLHDVTFQEPETEDVIRRIYEEGLLTREPLSIVYRAQELAVMAYILLSRDGSDDWRGAIHVCDTEQMSHDCWKD